MSRDQIRPEDYPFSPADRESVIVPHVLRGMIAYLTRPGWTGRQPVTEPAVVQSILEIIYPFYDMMESGDRARLVRIIRQTIVRCMKVYPDFREQITKIQDGELNPGTFQSLEKLCQMIAQEYESQKRITDEYD